MRGFTIVCVALAVGCAGSACTATTVEGTFGKRELHVSGTAFGWLDETEYIADSAGGTPVLSDRPTDAVQLHLIFSEAAFDPRVDMRTLPAGEQERILSDIARGDRLNVDVQRGSVIRPNDDIRLVANDGSLPPEVLPFITNVAVALGDPVLGPTARYPDHVARVGSKRTAKLTVTDTSPDLVGAVKITAKKADGEADGFIEGTVTVHFDIELLPERLAECNFAAADAGIVDPCTLN